jgi:hypothetical protein
MANFNKFDAFITQVGLKNHNLNTDTLKAFLTDELPLASDTVKGDMVEITAGGGYTAGGEDIQNTWAAGVLTAVDVLWTASGGGFGPFRYVVVYNDTGATKYLVGWHDRGVETTLNGANADTFLLDFGANWLTIT